jgi:hypothetical protein
LEARNTNYMVCDFWLSGVKRAWKASDKTSNAASWADTVACMYAHGHIRWTISAANAKFYDDQSHG